METSIPDLWVRQAAARAIAGYQKHLSPRKGFSCAHRLLHRGESCSQYTKRVILDQGLWAAIPAVRSRFAECKVANQVLQARRKRHLWQAQPGRKREKENPRDRDFNSQNSCSEADELISCLDCADPCSGTDLTTCMDCDWGELANCPDADCGNGLDCSGTDCSGADCSGSDCSGLDCSGCDCSGADCGSCG